MPVFTLINKTKRNLVLGDVKGKRITLRPDVPVVVEGRFATHPWVNHGWMAATEITTSAEEKVVAAEPLQPECAGSDDIPEQVPDEKNEERQESQRREEHRDDRERSQRRSR